MGRRSRKRTSTADRPARATRPEPRRAGPVKPLLPGALPTKASREPPPQAPWHPFPLVELCALLGLVLIVLGVLDLRSGRGKALMLCGMVVGSLAGLDTAVREHFAGYRPHAGTLAGLPAVGLAGVLFFAGAPWVAVVAAAVLAFAGGFLALRRAYRRRALL
jgi:hypothetical protein